ncbi:MAG: tRNA 4-thiouridine(8) synthase ThiI [Clostridia bacterium]|nr:tRNA 4-thiouridine(8) synthase ThiI [Clostridia bacterium]
MENNERMLILVRYGEVFLKGLNRPYFLRALVKNVRQAVKEEGAEVWLHDGRIFVAGFTDLEQCLERVCRVFGVHSACPAVEMEKEDFGAVCRRAAALMEGLTGSFKVSARRSDKRYFLDSPHINAEVGGAVLEANPALQVDLHHPDHVLNVEIRDKAYLYVRVAPGVGGMPSGTGGKAALLLSGGIDSPVAGWTMAKRGVSLVAVHFHSFPYTSDRAKEKVLELARLVGATCGGMKVCVVPFTHIQTEIHEKCPEDYTTLIMRRYMMRIAERIARQEGARALITGESLGQVASQTMEALAVTDAVVEMPVFRPLIGCDKSEIMDTARRIGTLATSELPYEDCCTVFTPRHPATRPRRERAEEGEARLESEALIQEALAGVETVLV